MTLFLLFGKSFCEQDDNYYLLGLNKDVVSYQLPACINVGLQITVDSIFLPESKTAIDVSGIQT
jgi:hypothetical protein